ncbi:hypothetical protein [Aquimarina hainanensis]|uniref:hypothetical protein n=1 Tax=Aquimarina hainanensis TaxID=1578017 RepID=UPI0036157F46
MLLGLSSCDDEKPDLHIDLYLLLKLIFNDFRDKTIASLVEEIKENGTVISLKGFNN